MTWRFSHTGGRWDPYLTLTAKDQFAKFYSLTEEESASYSINGGGVPIRVEGVEGIVGVIVVTGSSPRNFEQDDHAVIVDTIKEFLKANRQQ